MKKLTLISLSAFAVAALAASSAAPALAHPSPRDLGTLRLVTYDLWASTTAPQPGDHLIIGRDAYQSGPGPLPVAEVLILAIYGEYWFWPAWAPDFDYQIWTMEPGETYTWIFFDMIWPPGLDPGVSEIIGGLLDPDTWQVYVLDHLEITSGE